MVTHSNCPNIEKQLFAKVTLPDFIYIDNGIWVESKNDGLPEEIIKALNDNKVRDCIFTIAEKNNQSQAMQKYWKRRKLSERNINYCKDCTRPKSKCCCSNEPRLPQEFGPHSQYQGNG
jgi:hypothetical protein